MLLVVIDEGIGHRGLAIVVERDLAHAAACDLAPGLPVRLILDEVIGDLRCRIAEVDRVPDRESLDAPDLIVPAISDGRPRPVTLTLPIFPASVTTCAAATTPTVVGAMIDLQIRLRRQTGPWLRGSSCRPGRRHRRW